MKIKGHQKSSFIDYPDKICTVIFTGGCNFRCPYCHNSSLVDNKGEELNHEHIFKFLNKRKNLIDGVCISGGEPTLHKDLYEFIVKIKDMGLLVKLDTNGTNPNMLEKLLENRLVNYIAMDIKAPINKYKDITKSVINIYDILRSIEIIRDSEIKYEFRTTICKELLNIDDIEKIGYLIKDSNKYTIQNFRDGDTILDKKSKYTPFKREELKKLETRIGHLFKEFKIRY
ncbi:anaerobic ribonucleoside-triphosphate reductase activating protein [Gottschalkia purinilytica]|uniref:Anaerobic ribonucleoside-triphosphate reductase activating protein n=1 Tax=Gottschalkia purinilytica TaxID=1503 RepID=A0A0L0WA31_GOTPU|nr:anaerobic ribonucleoside-triphosphate reductase activating protein [Gottschalkia purinilytica]KNF08170.1 anaerobic ribonucleoside-triphosphate reductase activating protein [Gottschalkia purinilytica]